MILVLVFLYIITRLHGLSSLPIFSDEAIYLRWAREIRFGDLLVSLTDGKEPLYYWLLSLFSWMPSELLVARLLSVLIGLVTLLVIYFLARRLFGQRAGLVSGFLYLISPFAHFYNSLALQDGLLVMLLGIYIFFCFTKRGVLAGVIYGLCLWTKSISLPFLFVFFITNSPKTYLKFIIAVLALALPLIILPQYGTVWTKNANTFLGLGLFWQNMVMSFRDWMWLYFGLPLILALLSPLLSKQLSGRIPSSIWILWAILAAPWFLEAMVGKIFFPRYLLYLVLPVFVLSGYIISVINNGWTASFLLVFLVFSSFGFRLPEVERWQYYYGWPSGFGVDKLKIADKSVYTEDFGVGDILKLTNPVKSIRNLSSVKKGDVIVLDYTDGNILPPNTKLVQKICRQGCKSIIRLYEVE